ncbi:Sec-independent protein translocase protein TatB [Sphingomonas oligophenolica]|uniref:Twin-arginine translocase subunit TatB n=1 Tax=Sphingomonas oligophenolica TaxID=301154 RepID=A0ABU9Y7V5_9SPHN
MFDVAPTELLVLGAVALMVIPPKDLPKAMRVAGYWVGRARGVARQFRSGFDSMLRDAELQEMEKRWAEENARIMREHPPTPAMLMSPAPGDLVEQPALPVMTEKPVVSPAPEPEPIQAMDAASKPAPKLRAKRTPKPKPDKVDP